MITRKSRTWGYSVGMVGSMVQKETMVLKCISQGWHYGIACKAAECKVSKSQLLQFQSKSLVMAWKIQQEIAQVPLPRNPHMRPRYSS